MVLQPKRGDNILDLILTNHSDMHMVSDVEVGEPISDHNIVTFKTILIKENLLKESIIILRRPTLE